MEWKSCRQRVGYSEGISTKLIGDIYHEHLVLLSRDKNLMYEDGKNQLRCWSFRIQYFFPYFSLLETPTHGEFSTSSPQDLTIPSASSLCTKIHFGLLEGRKKEIFI